MGIAKPKFTRKNEIWCNILKIEDLSENVRKTQAGIFFVLKHMHVCSVGFGSTQKMTTNVVEVGSICFNLVYYDV